MHVPYFIKEHLWISATDETTLKNFFGGSKPSSKLTLKTKWYHRCGYCDDSRTNEQLKKHVMGYFRNRKKETKKGALFHYKTVKKGTPNLTPAYVHGLFKSLRAVSGNQTQFKTEINPACYR